jgi:hypothetical protein
MQENNPYAAPSSNLSGRDSYGEQHDGVTQGVVNELSRTRGWTLLLGILAIILGVVVLIGGLKVAGDYNRYSRSRSYSYYDSGTGTASTVTVVLTVVGAGVFLTYGILLIGFSSAVRRLVNYGQPENLVDSLRRQRTFWVFWGIVSILWFILTLLGFLNTARIF